MARPLRIAYPGAFYHITSRGNEKKHIFLSDRDRERFLSYLESAAQRYDAVIHAYCLMSNHYHLLLETPRGNLSEIMHHINGAYTTYFNTKRKRSGHLMQGRYKAIVVDADDYAQVLSLYIHLNPVRAGMAEHPEEYSWSSYQDYIGRRKSPDWLQRGLVLGYFGSRISTAEINYRKYVEAAIGRSMKSPLDAVVFSTFLGSDDFVESMKKHIDLKGSEDDRELPLARAIAPKLSLEDLERLVESSSEGDARLKRRIKLYLSQRHSGRRLKEIGRHYGIKESGVSQAVRRLEIQLAEDKAIRRKVEALEKELKLSRVQA